jgi:hypothetical protein
VQDQLPLESVEVVQSVVAPSFTVTVLPGSAVPAMVGVGLAVVLPSAGDVTTGAAGAVLSTVKFLGVLTGLVLPAGSVAVAVTVCGPSLKGVLGEQDQLPPASATAVQSVVVPSFTVTVLPGSAVPPIAGVVSLVCVTGVVMAGAAGAVLSTSKLRVAAGPVLPLGSVAVANTVCGPSLKGALGVQLHWPAVGPLASAVAVQSVTPPSFTVTVLPASAVPVMVGVLSLVLKFSVGVMMTGAAGATVSTVTGAGALAGLVLPAGSVWVAVSVCRPLVSGVVGVQVQLPAPSTTAVQTVVGPSFTVTVAPGSPCPLIAGVAVPTVPVGEVMLGATGAVVSTVKLRAAGGLVLPAGSVAVTNAVLGPSLKGVVGVQVQLPLPSAVAVQTGVPPTVTVMALLGSAVPLKVGVLSLVCRLSVGVTTVGAVGAVVSIVKLRVAGGLM